MARTAQATIKRFAIFVKERRQGKDVFVFRPYDVVELNDGDGPAKTYLQPHCHRIRSASEDEVLYDDVRTYNQAPEWDLMNPVTKR